MGSIEKRFCLCCLASTATFHTQKAPIKLHNN